MSNLVKTFYYRLGRHDVTVTPRCNCDDTFEYYDAYGEEEFLKHVSFFNRGGEYDSKCPYCHAWYFFLLPNSSGKSWMEDLREMNQQ